MEKKGHSIEAIGMAMEMHGCATDKTSVALISNGMATIRNAPRSDGTELRRNVTEVKSIDV